MPEQHLTLPLASLWLEGRKGRELHVSGLLRRKRKQRAQEQELKRKDCKESKDPGLEVLRQWKQETHKRHCLLAWLPSGSRELEKELRGGVRRGELRGRANGGVKGTGGT